MDKPLILEEELKDLLLNIRKNNRVRLLLFSILLFSFLTLIKWAEIEISWFIITILVAFLFTNVLSEYLARYIWAKQTIREVNFGYFIIQTIEISVFLLGFYFIEAILFKEISFPIISPLTLIMIAGVYIISNYFAFTRRIYPQIITLIFTIGYGILGLLIYFRILNCRDCYYLFQDSPLFLPNIFWTIGLFVYLAFYGDIFSKKTGDVSETFKIKNSQLAQKEEQLFQKEEEFKRSKIFLEREIETKTREIEDLTENLTQTKNSEKKLQEKIEELEKLQRTIVNREVQTKLKQGKDRILSVIENFNDGVLVFDRENNLFLINPQAELLLEKKTEDIIDKSIAELKKIPIFESLINFLDQKTAKIFRKEISPKKNLILEVTITPLTKRGQEMGKLIILHDITREKTIERIKTEFVSLSAHQLRTPLSAIKWTLRILLDGDLGKLTKEQRDSLERTYKSNERMISLINDLLNVTRIEEGRHIYKFLFCDFVKITQSVIDFCKGEIEKKKIQFEFEKPLKKLPRILADEEKIKLAIENILNNAIRYTFPGGKIVVSINLLKNKIEFKVQDTGMGIPHDEQPRVFTKFFRGVNAIRTETEGSGLGLFVTKNIIEAHGGSIGFKSEEGKGSTFYFTLPLKSFKMK